MVGLEAGAVAFGSPEPAEGLAGQGDGGLVVAYAVGQFERPLLGAVEASVALARDLGGVDGGAGAMDEDRAQVDVAAFGDSAASTDVASGTGAGTVPMETWLVGPPGLEPGTKGL